jgi:hypothetical protein
LGTDVRRRRVHASQLLQLLHSSLMALNLCASITVATMSALFYLRKRKVKRRIPTHRADVCTLPGFLHKLRHVVRERSVRAKVAIR